MSRTALALVLLAASGSVASAGTIIGVGIGTSPATSGDLNMREDGRSGRLQLGYSFGRIAVEGMVSRAEIARFDYAPFKWTSLAVAGKVNLPLGYQFEAFGRLGLHHTSVDQVEVDNSFAGSGFLIGGGFEYKLDIAGTGASVFVDYTIETGSTKSPTRGEMEYDLTSRVWTLGATVSL